MYQLPSHNLSIMPAVTHFDSDGHIVKKIEYHPQTPEFEGDIDLTLYNKDGTIEDVFKIPFRSFNNNLLVAIYTYGLNSNQNWVDTGGTNRTFSPSTLMRADAAISNSNYGIQVGASGSSATQSIDMRSLSGLITTGTAKGQLSYGATSLDTALSQVSGSWKFSATRAFTNSSTGNVTVTEVGFVVLANSFNIMLARDIADANGTAISVVVAPTQVLTVKYNFYFPISNGMCQLFPAHFLSMWSGNSSLTNIYYAYGNGDDGVVTGINGTSAFNRFNWVSSVAGADHGAITLGTGSQPLSCENWSVDWITQGSGSSQQLLYGDTVVEGYTKTYSSSGSSAEFVLRRTFTNGGPTVTVREAAVFGTVGTSNVLNFTTLTSFLAGVVIRTLTGDQVITSGSSMDVSYKFIVST